MRSQASISVLVFLASIIAHSGFSWATPQEIPPECQNLQTESSSGNQLDSQRKLHKSYSAKEGKELDDSLRGQSEYLKKARSELSAACSAYAKMADQQSSDWEKRVGKSVGQCSIIMNTLSLNEEASQNTNAFILKTKNSYTKLNEARQKAMKANLAAISSIKQKAQKGNLVVEAKRVWDSNSSPLFTITHKLQSLVSRASDVKKELDSDIPILANTQKKTCDDDAH